MELGTSFAQATEGEPGTWNLEAGNLSTNRSEPTANSQQLEASSQ